MDKREKLYNNLIGTGKVSASEIGTLDEFRSAISDENKAKQFHNNLKSIFSYDEIGDEDAFASALSLDFTQYPVKPNEITFDIPNSFSDLVSEENAQRETDGAVTPYIIRKPYEDLPTTDPGRKVPGQNIPYDQSANDQQAPKPVETTYDGAANVYAADQLGIKENTQAPENWALDTLKDTNTQVSPDGITVNQKPSDFVKATEAIANRAKQFDYPRMDYVPSYMTNTERLKQKIEGELSDPIFEKVYSQPIGTLTVPNTYKEFKNKQYAPEGYAYESALNYVQKADKLIKAEQDNKSFVHNVGKGAKESLLDPNTWFMGLPDFGDNMAVVDALKKEEAGEDLTDAEQTLLDAAANLSLTQLYVNLPRGYKAGTQFGQQIPFMLSIIAGGAVAKTALSGVKSQMLKYIAKKSLGKTAKGLAKAGMHVMKIGALGTAGELMNPGAILKDASARMVGDVTPGTEYTGRQGNVGTGEALGRAFVSQNIEYTSEQVGEFGSLLTPVLKRIGAPIIERLAGTGIAKAIKAMNTTDMAKFMKAGAWNGFAPEIFEEYVANVMHAATGDQEWSSLADKDQFIDTVLGVATTMGFFEGAKALDMGANIASNRYKYRKLYESSKKEAESTFDANTMSVLDAGDVEATASMLEQMDANTAKVAMSYLSSKSNYDALVTAIQKRTALASEEADKSVKNNTNKDTGAIETAKLDKAEDVVVIGGVFDAEPTELDGVGSTNLITIRHENGEVEQVDYKRLTQFQREDANTQAQIAAQQASDVIMNQEVDAIAYSPENVPQIGQEIAYNGQKLTIGAINGNTVELLDENEMPVELSMDDVRDSIQERLDAIEDEQESNFKDAKLARFSTINEVIPSGNLVGSKFATNDTQKFIPEVHNNQQSNNDETLVTILEKIPRVDISGVMDYDYSRVEPERISQMIVNLYQDEAPEFVADKKRELVERRGYFFDERGKIKDFMDTAQYIVNKHQIAEIDRYIAYWDKVLDSIQNTKPQVTNVSKNSAESIINKTVVGIKTHQEVHQRVEISNEIMPIKDNEMSGLFEKKEPSVKQSVHNNQEPGRDESVKDRNLATLLNMIDNRNEKIKSLNDQVSDLKKEMRTNASDVKKNAQAITMFAKSHVKAETFNNMQKSEYSAIMDEVNNAMRTQDLALPFARLVNIINEVDIRTAQNQLDNLLSLKVVDQNQRGVSVTKNVDEKTRVVMQEIKDAYEGMSSVEKNKQIPILNEEAKALKDELLGEIDNDRRIQINKRLRDINTEKVRIAERVKRNEATKKSMEAERIQKQIDNLMEQDEWTDESYGEYLRLLTVKSLADILSLDADLINNGFDIEKVEKIKRGEAGYDTKTKQLAALEAQRGAILNQKLDAVNVASGILRNGIQEGNVRLQEWLQAKVDRRKTILQEVYKAIKWRKLPELNDSSYKESWLSSIPVILKAPMMSFEFMLKHMDRNHPAGEGPLYNRLMLSEDGVIAANDNYLRNKHDGQEMIDKKSLEVFNNKLPKQIRETSDIKVGVVHLFDNKTGESYARDFSVSQAAYVYAINRMKDGNAKLYNQGFTDESMTEIEDLIGKDMMEYVDWATDEFLPMLRNERYNPTHVKMFGTSMASRDHYFPFKIDNKSIADKGEIGEEYVGMPSVITGNIINRTNNRLPIDTEQNFFQVLERYIDSMEKWSAYTPLIEDLNQILKSVYVKNQMNANENKSFQFFKDTCAIATRQHYNDKTTRTEFEHGLARVNRAVALSKISLRPSTAIKQILALPAFLEYSTNIKFMSHLLTNLSLVSKDMNGGFSNIATWAFNELPTFRERVKSGYFGNEVLMYDKGHSKLGIAADKLANVGMYANRLVDAYSCAVGAKAVYDFAKSRYMMTMPENQADNLAKYTAINVFNKTQQSSDPAYISPMQADSGIFNRFATTFMNNNIGYSRLMFDGIDDLSKKGEVVRKQLEKEYQEAGYEDYEKRAKADTGASQVKGLFKLALFGWGMQLLWEYVGVGVFGFGGDDEKRKKSLLVSIPTAPLQGTPIIGNFASSVGDMTYDAIKGKKVQFRVSTFLLADELEKSVMAVRNSFMDYGFSPEAFKAAVGYSMAFGGVNAETIENFAFGINAIAKSKGIIDDLELGALFILNLPASQRKDLAAEIFKDVPLEVYAEKMATAYKAVKESEARYMVFNKPRTQKLFNSFNDLYDQINGKTSAEKPIYNEEELQLVESKIKTYERKIGEFVGDSAGLAKYIAKNKNIADLLNDEQYQQAKKYSERWDAFAKAIDKYLYEHPDASKSITYGEIQDIIKPLKSGEKRFEATSEKDKEAYADYYFDNETFRTSSDSLKQVIIDRYNHYKNK